MAPWVSRTEGQAGRHLLGKQQGREGRGRAVQSGRGRGAGTGTEQRRARSRLQEGAHQAVPRQQVGQLAPGPA